MKVEIITIGNELLSGQVNDTNAVFLGQQLEEMGLSPQRRITVGDDSKRIEEALTSALKRAELVLMTGGLGATEDDVTRSAVAQALGRKLVLNERLLGDIQQRQLADGRKTLGGHQSLALIPQGAKVLNNPRGLAPGLMLKVDDKLIFALPGVPQEMQAIFEQEMAPALKRLSTEACIRRRRFRTVGIGELALSNKLRSISRKGFSLAYLARPWHVDIWLTVRGASAQEAKILLALGTHQIEEQLEDQIYGVDDDTLERVVAALLLMKGMSIAVAESCTGGHLADRLTDVPGSSAYFERGVVAYSNQAKRQILKVPLRILNRFGAVSHETALAMAQGIRKISGTDIGLSTTGIAGPGGATAEKPVGLAFIGLVHGEHSIAHRFLFGQDRKTNKECCVLAALNLVRQHLLKL